MSFNENDKQNENWKNQIQTTNRTRHTLQDSSIRPATNYSDVFNAISGNVKGNALTNADPGDANVRSGVTSIRTDFSGLFSSGHKFCNSNRDYIATEPALPPATRTRHRNASRTQKPLPYYNTAAAASSPYSALSSTSHYGLARSSDLQELQFEVDCYEEEEDGDMSATSRPDSMTGATNDNLNEVNFPHYFRHHDSYNAPSAKNATKTSFNSSGIENCATIGYEAIDYFSSENHGKSKMDKSITNSSKRQNGNVQNKGNEHQSNGFGIFEGGMMEGGMMDIVQAVERPPPKRQRHFSLEDYNDLIMESSNSNASIDNSGGGSDDHQHTTSTITSFANLGNFFSNFNSSPLSRRNSFSTGSQAVGAKFGNNDYKPFNGATFGGNYHPGDGFMPSAAEEYDVNLDSGNSIITRHLRAELENRLVMAINCNDNANADTVDNGSDSIRNTCEQDTVSPKLKFPDNLVSVIAGHVIQESSLEPCGLKGCVIYIYLEDDEGCQYVNCLRCDPETVPTFELTLTLRSSPNSNPFLLTRSQSSIFSSVGRRPSWGDRLLPSLVRNIRQTQSTKPVSILVSTSYKLVKRRKYRLNESPQQLCL